MMAGVRLARLTLHRGSEPPRALEVGVAVGWWARLRGLCFSRGFGRSVPGAQALLIPRCGAVHSCWMRYAIDLAWLDARGVVVATREALPPWRAARCAVRSAQRPLQVLEFPAGALRALDLRRGDACRQTGAWRRQRGAAMVEFAVIGPLLTLIGLMLLQLALLLFARQLVAHATFMAARAGSTGNADVATMRGADLRAVIPLHGAADAAELLRALGRAEIDAPLHLRIEILNPTPQAFDDWNDPGLQRKLGKGRAVIPNTGLALRAAGARGTRSGLTLHEANVLKIRAAQGIEPVVPLAGPLLRRLVCLRQPESGPQGEFVVAQCALGRIVVSSTAVLQMQSDAVAAPP